jgi:hypothetical protein
VGGTLGEEGSRGCATAALAELAVLVSADAAGMPPIIAVLVRSSRTSTLCRLTSSRRGTTRSRGGLAAPHHRRKT